MTAKKSIQRRMQVKTEGSGRNARGLFLIPFRITGIVPMRHVSVVCPGVLSISISLRRWRTSSWESLTMHREDNAHRGTRASSEEGSDSKDCSSDSDPARPATDVRQY